MCLQPGKGGTGEAACIPASQGGLAAPTHGSDPHAIYASVAMAIPNGSNSCGMVTDYRAVNDTIEPAAMSMPNLEVNAPLSAGATAYCTLDMLQGYY